MTCDKTDVTALVKYAQSLEAEIERLRAALKGAKIALVRDGNVTAAAEILMRADEQREDTK